jgi:PAS domain S-box-containing protein
VVALLIWSAWLGHRNTSQLYENSVSVAETHALLDALDRLVGTVTDAETGERGFVITGERRYLEPYNNAVAAVDEYMKYLVQLTRDSPRRQMHVRELKLLIAKRRDQMRRLIELRTDKGLVESRKFVLTGKGKRTMDAIRAAAAEMRLEEEVTLAKKAVASKRSFRIAIITELTMGALGLCMVLAFSYLLRRHLLTRARAAAALREEKEWFVTTLGSIGDAVIATDTMGRVTFLNNIAQHLTGWTRVEAEGEPLDKVFHIVSQKTRTRIENPALRALRQGEAITLDQDTLLIARDGKERPIDDSAAPIREKGKDILGVVLVFRDITERRRGEESLRFLADTGMILSSSLNYDATLKNVARLAVGAIADYCFFDLLTENGGVKRVAWAHKDPKRQIKIGAIGRFVPARESENDPVIKTLSTGQTVFVSELGDAWLRDAASSPAHYRYMRDMHCYSLMTVPVAVKGRTLGALTFCRSQEGQPHYTGVDRNLAEELGRRAGLAVQNAMLHQQLEQSAQELRRADRRKDEFLAVLAHELRNPLTPLRNGLRIIRTSGDDVGTVERTLGMMERQLRQMVRLIEDLLDLSRITEGKLELRKEPVELAAVVNSAVETSRPTIEAFGHALEVILPPEPVYMEADPVRLGQVFSNLLNNGAKYAERGGHISLRAQMQDGHVLVTVRDTGIGIPAEMLAKVFDPFTQVDSSIKRSGGGLGIGLTLVKQLVGMHGGTVEAHSEGRGQGSAFMVRLPTSTARPAERKQTTPQIGPVVSVSHCHRILVADDNEDAADSLGALLRTMGHEVRVVYDGQDALTLAAIFQPDAILLDIGMPRLSGHDVARDIRSRPWGKQVVLIALTGYGQEKDKLQSLEAGFNYHLVKPAEPTALEKLLANLESTAA